MNSLDLNSISAQRETAQDYRLHALLFSFAICIRLLFLGWIDEPILFVKYPYFAEKVAGGVDIGDRLVDLSPFYLYFLSILKNLFGLSWPFIKGLQIVVGATNSLLVFIVGSRLFSKDAAFMAAVIFAAYGNMIIFETTFEPEVFLLLFNLLSVYFLVLFNTRSLLPSKRFWITLTAGICTGMGVITKPNFLLFLPAGVIWILFCQKTGVNLRKRLSYCLLFLFAASVLIAPITVRNYVKFNDFILITADAGKVFFHGNSKTATAIVGADLRDDSRYRNRDREPDYAHVLFRQTAAKIAGRPLKPSESSSFWVRITLKDILDDPFLHLKRCIKKVIHFFTDYEVHYIASAYKEYKESLSYPFVRYGMIVALGFLGIALSIRSFRELLLIYETIGLYLLSCTLFLVSARYRIPAVPYLCLFAGHAIYRLKEMATGRQFKQLAISFLVLGAMYLSTHLAFRRAIVVHDQWQEATKLHYEMNGKSAFNAGRYDDAITALNNSIKILPGFCPAYILRGKSHAMLEEFNHAESDFIRAIHLTPTDSMGYRNLGFLYLLQGKMEPARNHLIEALKRDPQDTKAAAALLNLDSKKKADQDMNIP